MKTGRKLVTSIWPFMLLVGSLCLLVKSYVYSVACRSWMYEPLLFGSCCFEDWGGKA